LIPDPGKIIMKVALIILALFSIAKTTICQSLPNSGFEDWHFSNGVMNPQYWDTPNEASYILVEAGNGLQGGSAVQLNVIWDEVIKSYVAGGLSLSYSDTFTKAKFLTGYYKAQSNTYDSLNINIKLFSKNLLCCISSIKLGGNNNIWDPFSIQLNQVGILCY